MLVTAHKLFKSIQFNHESQSDIGKALLEGDLHIYFIYIYIYIKNEVNLR